jgi:hypothetical protein
VAFAGWGDNGKTGNEGKKINKIFEAGKWMTCPLFSVAKRKANRASN